MSLWKFFGAAGVFVMSLSPWISLWISLVPLLRGPDEQEQLLPQDSCIKSQYPATQSVIPNSYHPNYSTPPSDWEYFSPRGFGVKSNVAKLSHGTAQSSGEGQDFPLDLPPPHSLTCQVTLDEVTWNSPEAAELKS